MTTPNQKPVIFLAFANEQSDASRYLRNLTDERREVRDVLKPLEDRGVRVEAESNVDLDFILKTFRNNRHFIPIFHYGGHSDSYSLLLEAENRTNVEANARELAEFLKPQNGLKLVFLNGCSNRGQVQALREAGVGAVIATLKDINDTTARVFAVGFYKSLMTGASIQVAFEEAQAEIQIPRSGSREESSRQLYRNEVTTDTDRFPWVLEGTPEALGWSLADALNDPTFGLPDLPDDIGLPQEPYRNLERFKREDARVFFGRGRDTVELLNFITAKGATASPVVLLYGQTGVGKSSVLEAGVLPRLEANHHVLYLRRDPKRELLGTLEHELISMTALTGTSVGAMWRAAEEKENRPVVVILDQLDEAFPISATAGNNASVGNMELEKLLDALRVVFTSSDQRPLGKIVLGFRQEVLANVNYALKQRDLKYAWKFLKSLDRSGIIEAINGPSKEKTYNLKIEPDVLGEIASDLLADRESPIAPTLQILMDRLWTDASINDDPKITLAQYDALRKPKSGEQQQGGLFEQFFKAKITALEVWKPEVVESGLLYDLLEFHTTALGAAKQNTLQDLETKYQHRADILEVVGQARQERLLVGSATKNGPPATRLAHDTLGPLVQKEFRSSQKSGQRARRILENRIVDWQDGKTGNELGDTDLKLVEAGLNGMKSITTGSDEERLLKQSRLVRQAKEEERKADEDQKKAQQVALEAANQKTALERQQRLMDQVNANRKLQNQLNITRGLLFFAFVAVGLAIWQGREAKNSRDNSIGLQLAKQAVLDIEDQYDRALLLGNEATQLVENASAEDSLLRVLQSKDSRFIGFIQGHKNPALSVSFSPDGKMLATSSRDNTVRLWDISNRKQIGEPITGHTGYVYTVSFSPDSKILATGSADNTIRFWDVSNRKQIGEPLTGHTNTILSVSFSPDGKILATGSLDKTVRFWDVSNHTQIEGPPIEYTNYVYSVSFSPDSKMLAVGSFDNTVRFWDVSNHKQIGEPIANSSSVNSVAFSPDGKTLAIGSDDTKVRLWNVSNHTPFGTPFTNTDSVYSVSFSPDGKTLATGSSDNTVRLWDISSYTQIGAPFTHTGYVSNVPFSPDGKTLATGSDDNNTVRLWNVSNHKRIETPLAVTTVPVSGAVLSPDGKMLATGNEDATVRLWDVLSHEQIENPFINTGYVLSISFSPDGKMLATGSADNKIRLWDVSSRKQIEKFDNTGYILSISFNPNGKMLATGSNDGTVHLWDIPSLTQMAGKSFTHTGYVLSVAFSPDGKMFATGSRDQSVRLWNVSNHKLIEELSINTGNVSSISFSPDGKSLATGSENNIVTLWDIPSRKQIGKPFQGHMRSVSSVVFTPDGKTLVSSSADKTVRFWDVSLESWRTRACTIANRNLTLKEWRDSVGNLSYQKTCPDLPDPPDLELTTDEPLR